MKTESTETQEKKLETLEEAAMTVLNEELPAPYVDLNTLILFRERMSRASSSLKEIYKMIQNVRKTIFDEKIENIFRDPTQGGVKSREALNVAADNIKAVIQVCDWIQKRHDETGRHTEMGVLF